MQTGKIKIRTVSKMSSGNKMPKPSKQERYDRLEKQDRLERPDKFDRLERPERPDRPEKRSLVIKLRLPREKLAALALPPEQRGYKLHSSLNPSLKRKAEGAPDGFAHSVKKQNLHSGVNGFGSGKERDRESLIVKLRLGREKCLQVQQRYRKRDG